MRDEYACTVEDPYRRWPASGVPHAIGVRGDSKLGGERRQFVRTRQGFPTRTEGLWWHGPDHHAIGGRDMARRYGPWAYFSQLISEADRSFQSRAGHTRESR